MALAAGVRASPGGLDRSSLAGLGPKGSVHGDGTRLRRFAWGAASRFPASEQEGRQMARLNKTSGQARAGGGEVVSLDEPLLDCVAAAALLNVRVSWVRDAARLGHLPCVRVGRHLRFTRVMLEDWLVVQLARRVRTRARSGAAPRRHCWRAWRRGRMAARLSARGSDFRRGSGTGPRRAWWISAAAAGAALGGVAPERSREPAGRREDSVNA